MSRELRFDFPGLRVGIAEYEDGPTGCTVFHLPPGGAACSVDIRGGSPGTIGNYEWAHAVCFAGGSLYGLEAACGVAAELMAMRGNTVGWEDVELVLGAIVYDFGRRDNAIYPDAELGRQALRAAEEGAFRSLVDQHLPGAELRLVPSLRGPVTALNGQPVSALKAIPEGAWILRGDRGLTFARDLPLGNEVVDNGLVEVAATKVAVVGGRLDGQFALLELNNGASVVAVANVDKGNAPGLLLRTGQVQLGDAVAQGGGSGVVHETEGLEAGNVGGVDDVGRDSILRRTAGIEVLHLREHRGADALGDTVELDERGVADEVGDGAGVSHGFLLG